MVKNSLFTPISVGQKSLSHRVVLAPMTRARACPTTLGPTKDTVTYYEQRASDGGLLISEAIHISPEATPTWTIYSTVRENGGQVPGIWTLDQTIAWREVTEAVHTKGGVISCQLLHTGRVAQPGIGEHPIVRQTTAQLPPVSSSATPLEQSDQPGDYNWDQIAKLPRALETVELSRLVQDYCLAARNAHKAGFDYVEIHAAHGYLIEQFMCDGVNKREDHYGGSKENRCRLLFEIIEALVAELGPDRVAIRLSPTTINPATGKLYQMYFGVTSSDAEDLWDYAIQKLNTYPLAYLLLTEPRVGALSVLPLDDPSIHQPLRNARFRTLYGDVLIGAGGFTPNSALEAVGAGAYDMIAFGRWFLSNPDLPERLLLGSPLNLYDRATFYGGGTVGYTDYPEFSHKQNETVSHYELIEQNSIRAGKKSK